MVQILNGRALADKIKIEIKNEILQTKITPGLGVVLVGTDPASHLYVALKEKACVEVGIKFEKIILPATAATAEVMAEIEKFNARADINAILIQMPLPQQINESTVINSIDPKKDVDGFHPQTLLDLKTGHELVVPGLVSGIYELLKSSGQNLSGQTVAVIANSPEFFSPIEIYFKRFGMNSSFFAGKTVLSCHPHPQAGIHNVQSSVVDPSCLENDKNMKGFKKFDIIIIALGRPNFLVADMIKPNAIIIDVGINQTSSGLCGDADFDSISKIASFITPVPGGVGPMTVAMLLKNTLKLALIAK